MRKKRRTIDLKGEQFWAGYWAGAVSGFIIVFIMTLAFYLIASSYYQGIIADEMMSVAIYRTANDKADFSRILAGVYWADIKLAKISDSVERLRRFINDANEMPNVQIQEDLQDMPDGEDLLPETWDIIILGYGAIILPREGK